MKDWLKHMFQLKNELSPLAAVDCCLIKWKRMGSICSFFHNWLPLVSVMVSTRKKNLRTKQNSFHWPENPFSLAGMKNFVEKYFIGTNLWKIDKKMVSTGKKFGCPLARIIFRKQDFFKKIGFRLLLIMLSTSRQKALEPVPRQNNVTF